MNNLLMREIPLNCTIRLWDTYHVCLYLINNILFFIENSILSLFYLKAEPFGFSDFHLYVCAAFLLRYSKNLIEEKDFQVLKFLIKLITIYNIEN
jgi:hypothetical protein